MKPAAKQDEQLARRREIARDVLALAGLVLTTAGVDMQFGHGWALICLGGLCLAAVIATMRA